MAVSQPRPGSPFERDSPSPAPQPQMTKRDVRRNRMVEKLQHMMDSFNANQHQHYRAQLQAVQVDMNLILRADPYEGIPLEDGGDEIRSLVEGMGANMPGDDAAQGDFFAMAGNRYRTFVREANDAIEHRDADLTALHNQYQTSVSEVDRLTQQKIHQAEEEHKALGNQIRQRLITTITKRRQQLLRDKEQLDISDSNALLLNPNQFSLNNPGSPGGGQNRKTRHLRHRAISPSGGDENGKRKRKLPAMDDEGHESPAPAFRSLPPPDNLGGGRSPFKDARDKSVYAQFEAPAYSLERLFTDKELAHATNTAQIATYKYFYQPDQQQQDSNSNTNADPSVDNEARENASAADAEDAPNGALGAGEAVNTPPVAAPEMERTSSHQVLTRGGARANPLAALSDLATAAAVASGNAATMPIRDNPFAPVVPNYHAVMRSEKSGAPAPPAVNTLDAENDFELMRRAGSNFPSARGDDSGDVEMGEVGGEPANGAEVRNALLDQALGASLGASQPYRLPLLETGPALIGRGVDRVPATGFAPVASILEQRLKVQAAATANAAGSAPAPAVGGNTPSALRGHVGVGAEPMSRTTSAAGSEMGEAGTATGRRGRQGRLV
ncbi:hypothetical protein Q7P37_009347 [Cladosporium fusiforme]